MHITTVSMSLPFLRGQAAYMRERGIDLAAISSPGPELHSFAERERVPVHAVEMVRSITPLRDVAALVRLVRTLRKIRPHIVHAHTPKGGLLGMMAAAAAAVPVRIYHMRGLPLMTADGGRYRLLKATERTACRLSHRTLCVSRSLRDVALRERLCSAERIHVPAGGSGQGVDAAARFNPASLPAGQRSATREQLGIPPGVLVVGFVGRVVRDKGVPELVSAFRRVRTTLPEAHLLIVGPMERQDPLPADVEKEILTDPLITWAGLNWDTPALYSAMDLVVLPSHREGFPNVPLEAAAMELPVVTTRVPGCCDSVQDGITGALVRAGDAADLARVISAYLADPELRVRQGKAGRVRVLSGFRPEQVWHAIFQHYLQLLKEQGVEAGGTVDPAPDP